MTGGCLKDIDVIILAGGLGTRIRGILGDTPKVLAPINGKPYLEHLLEWLEGFGAQRIIMSLGHLSDKVEAYLRDRPQVECIAETKPLGTGGSIRYGRPAFRSEPVLIMNGDTWLGTDLEPFVESHIASGRALSLMCVEVDDVSRYGKLEIDGSTVRLFLEKDPDDTGPGYVNGGVYLFSQNALDELCAREAVSLERDYFFRLAPGSIGAFIPKRATFIDIGTSESLEASASVLSGKQIKSPRTIGAKHGQQN